MYDIKDKIDGISPYTEMIFMSNIFQYPAPGTDFTPQQKGAELGASLATKKVWVPLDMIRIGDRLVSYKVIGIVTSGGNTVTVDAKISKTAKDGTVTDIVDGGIIQVSKTANYTMDEEAVLSAAEAVATDYMYNIEIEGTTTAVTGIIVVGIELKFNRMG